MSDDQVISTNSSTSTSTSKNGSGLHIVLLTRNDIVRQRVMLAVSILGGDLHHETCLPEALMQPRSTQDIYVIDPDLLSDPASEGIDLLDDAHACVVLFGGPAGLAATRPAVHRVVNVDMGPLVLAKVLREVSGAKGAAQCPTKLSQRERETLYFCARGMTLKEIGHSLGISAKSAETYKARACRKLDLTSRAAILAFTQPSLRSVGMTGDGPGLYTGGRRAN